MRDKPADKRTAVRLSGRSADQQVRNPIADRDVEMTRRVVAQLLAESAADAEILAERIALDAKRQAYVDRLIEAADGDMSMTWQEAHDRLSASNDKERSA